MIWVVIGIVIVVAGLGLIVWTRRRNVDGVTSFQRQIDALSPEARRSVVDQVQGAADKADQQELDDDRDSPPDDPEPGSRRGVDGA